MNKVEGSIGQGSPPCVGEPETYGALANNREGGFKIPAFCVVLVL